VVCFLRVPAPLRGKNESQVKAEWDVSRAEAQRRGGWGFGRPVPQSFAAFAASREARKGRETAHAKTPHQTPQRGTPRQPRATPGSPRPTPTRALKGRPTPHTDTRTRHPYTHDPDPPFQGFSSFQPPSPGRCPGLPWVAPLGLREQMTQISCQAGRTCRTAAPSPDESAVFRSLISTA
jgi:hypothetical protein